MLLHIVDTVLDRDLRERNARWRGLSSRQHSSEVQRGMAVLEVQLVHGGGEACTIAFIGEELRLMLAHWNEISQGNSNEERSLELGALRSLAPKRAQDFEQSKGVLAVAKARLHTPAGVFDAGEMLPGLHAVSLFVRELVADGNS